jgi:hypothetical protein
MFSKKIVLFALLSEASARFTWTNPGSYLPGLYNYATNSAHTFDTKFKQEVFESLLNTSEDVNGRVVPHFNKDMRT